MKRSTRNIRIRLPTGDCGRPSSWRVRRNIWSSLAGLALMAVGGCASPRPPAVTDADWVSHITTGRAAYERGDFRRAAEAFHRAQQRARALDEAEALAVAAANRAIALAAAGQPHMASAAVREALGDARLPSSRRLELLAAGARAQNAAGNYEEALGWVAEALREKPGPGLRHQLVLTQASAELARGALDAAAAALAKIPAKEWRRLSPSLQAEEAELRAKMESAAGRPASAMKGWDQASGHWKKAGRLPAMARALAEAARQAQAAGDLPGACDRYYRAARSLEAQGLLPEAVRILQEGVACAESLPENEEIHRKLAEMVVTFNENERLSK